jgi:lysophospholipase L1-like esterase
MMPIARRSSRPTIRAWTLWTLALVLAPCWLAKARAGEPAPRLLIAPGDRIALIGNTLAERMQHDGWLEAFLVSRFPKHDLVIRNLGFSGDELTLRLRSADFGSPDEWLTRTRADVVFAFFGYNESFAGEAGLARFRADLEAFIKHTLGQKYNGKRAPRLVLFSPIAHEDLHDRNLPDGKENNGRLALYTRAMGAVAAAQGVAFVDLFSATREAYPGAPQPLTINGVHLTESGNFTVAHLIDAALFDPRQHVPRTMKGLESIRQAVLEKNHTWFNRYRTVDGYSIFGGRADLSFVGESGPSRRGAT